MLKLLLIAITLCLGYKTYIDGDKEIGIAASIGRVIGMLAIAVALLSLVCGICKYKKYGSGCAAGKSFSVAASCPISGK